MTRKIGDVVSLKSQGGKMTVESVDGDSVVCVWFDGKNIKRAPIHTAMLTEGDGSIEGVLERLDEDDKKL